MQSVHESGSDGTATGLICNDKHGLIALAGTYISDLGQGHLHTPQLPLIPKTVFSDQFQLTIKALFLEGTPWLLECFPICDTAKVS
jgi:hypothetical protein